jgi:hypothetical protein
MSDRWQYQIRIYLGDKFAEMARRNPHAPALALLTNILNKHGATMKCQFDAFAGYLPRQKNTTPKITRFMNGPGRQSRIPKRRQST